VEGLDLPGSLSTRLTSKVEMPLDLRTHQKKALTELGDGKILWGPPGTGKSRVAVGYYQKMHWGRDVYVITTAKKRDTLDWEREFALLGVGKYPGGTLAGLLTVDSWNNIAKYRDVKDAFFILDEQRLVGRGKWVRSFLRIAKHNPWILLSATPGDTWMDYIPIFVANNFYKNRTEFELEHVVYAPHTNFPKVRKYLNEEKLKKHRNAVLVPMPYSTQKTRHSTLVRVNHNEALVRNVIKTRWHIYQNKPIRDMAELLLVLRRIVNSDPSRIRAVRELLEEHDKIVLFYNFNYELEILRTLKDEITIAEWNGHKHEPIPSTKRWVYLVQYAAGSEGWNCTETNCLLFYSLTYSYKNWEQAHGRIDRLNVPFLDLWYYTLRSKSLIDDAIWRSLSAKKSFNASQFSESGLTV
jgi:hypothetical protein